jgi:predicted O-methyltransferase YrrM
MPRRPLRQRARNAVRRVSGAEARDLRDEINELRAGLHERDPFLKWSPPGHFYSPLPDMAEVRRREDKIWVITERIPGVDLDEDGQRKRFTEIAALVADVDPPQQADPAWRYRTENDAFGVGDALMLNGMLRTLRPRRWIEVGSGWSSAWLLDTVDRWLGGSLDITFIEPYPELLHSVMRPEDHARVTIDPRPLQEIPTETFQQLESGDVLFIDSTHVLKIDSDVRHVFHRVLPAVPPGVYVHVHDVFWPFEYPYQWVRDGRAWNELYILEAFLQFNDAYELVLWNDWLFNRERPLVKQLLPAMATNAGGSLWLRRRES